VKYRALVLGATGVVGQRFVSLLSRHPWFELVALVASSRSAGQTYGDTVKWVIEDRIPEDVASMKLEPLDLNVIESYKPDVVFSALPSEVYDVEVELAKKGFTVVSNSSPMRLEPDIPLLNPEVNADHVEVVEVQRERRGWRGFIVKVPNCTTAILTLSLKPILDEFGVRRVIVSTMQAISGAGLTGLPAMLIQDNVIPYIEGEEEKVENETLKILGKPSRDGVKPAEIKVSASCHRVPVLEGHMEAVFVETIAKLSVDDVVKAMEEFRGNKLRGLNLPTAPPKPIVVRREKDRPQTRLDRMEGKGMAVVVGRIRVDNVIGGVKYIVLGHNTIRGAAGTGVLIAELLAAKNMIPV